MGIRSAKARQPRGIEKKSFLLRLLLLVVLYLSCSCGYRLGENYGESKVLGDGVILVGKITNETSYSRVGVTLGEKIKDALLSSGYNSDFDRSGDYLIKGSIHELKERPIGFSEERLGLEYEISCVVSIELIESATGKSAFHLEKYNETSTYYRGVDPSYSRTNREKAVEFVLEKISLRFVDFLKEM